MIKKVPVFILIAVCAVLSFVLNGVLRDNARLTRELSDADSRLATLVQSQATDPVETSDAAALAGASSATESQVNPDTVQDTLEGHQRIMTSIANMRDNPTMNKVIEASQRGTIGALYSDIIDFLDLTPEETQYFMEMLMSRQMENVDFGMKLMSGQMTAEERQEKAEHLHEIHDEMYKQMKVFLNDEEDYQEFEFYEKTMNERMALSQMDQALTGTDDELSGEGYRDLLDMMHEESKNFDWSTDLHDQESTDVSPERFSEENMMSHTDDMYELVEKVLAQAGSMLTPGQLEALTSSLMATTDMQVAQFQMVGPLLGGAE
jgi:hypothetical protein